MRSAAIARSALTVSLSLATAAAQAAPVEPARPKTYDTSRLEAEFKRQCVTGEFSGTVVVRAGGREVFSDSCGEADPLNHIANTRQTRFKIYSTSKLVTALTVMRLSEQKRLSLDAPITRYIAEAPAAWNKVTLRTLLNHTAGVKDLTANLVSFYRQDYDAAAHATLVALTPDEIALDSPPGVKFAYNNFGFELLAIAVERVTGEAFPAVVQKLVFDPAGMKTASFQPPGVTMSHLVDTPEDGLALGYNGEPGKLVQANNWAFVQMGAGAIRATVDDFVALDAALGAGRIVSPATLREMVSAPVTPPAGYPVKERQFGLGIFVQQVDGVRLEGHTGGTNGYISDFERLPDDGAMMIALTNRGFVKTGWLRTAVADMVKAARR